MPSPLRETVNESSLWASPLMEWATDLAPRAGWALGVELVRGGLLLLVIAVAIRAAGGVRARYRILGAGVVLALLMPLAGMSPGVWRVGVPYEMNRGGAAVREVEPSELAAGVPIERPVPITVFGEATHHAASPVVRLRSTDRADWLASVPPTVTGSATTAAAGPVPGPASVAASVTASDTSSGFEVLGWSISDVRALGDRAMCWANAAAAQPLTWIGLWALGALGVLLWGVVGVLRLGAIARAAQPADDRWVLEAERAMKRLGIRRVVRVVVSGSVPVPMTWGVWRPIVVVPTAGDAWDAERRRVVLTHELVHVRRLDWALQVAAWVVVSLHWCNPLAWWAVRRLAVERERSCDAAVVASGTRPSAYASHLLDIARAMSDVRSPVHALGMAKASELEGRLMSILNGTRRGAKRSVGAAVLVMFAGLAAAAVAPQAIPPEKQAELERREAELAQLEAQLAQKRAALEEARVEAEVAEVDARDRAEAERRAAEDLAVVRSRETKPERARAVTVRGEPARGAVRVRGTRAPRPAQVEGVVRAQRPSRVSVASPESAQPIFLHGPDGETVVLAEPSKITVTGGYAVVSGEPTKGQRVIVYEGEIGPDSNSPLEKWRVLSKDKDALRAKLRSIEPVEAPELGEEMARLEKLQIELEARSQKLEGVAVKLRPVQEKLEERQQMLEPYQEQLEQLHMRMQEEMEAVHEEAAELENNPALQELELDLHEQEMEMRDRLVAVGEQIKEAAQQGDLEKLRQYEEQISELVRQRDKFAAQAHRHAERARDLTEEKVSKIRQHQQEVVEKYQRQMEDLHAEMERVHEAMGESHQGMDKVHEEMDGVHEEMEVVHEQMDEIHQRIQERVSHRVAQLIHQSLEAEGLSADNPKAKTVIGLTCDAIGSRMIIDGPDGGEMLHITDPSKTYDRMLQAIEAAQDSGELELSDSAKEKLERALKRAADRSEVIRFRVPKASGGAGGGDGWSAGASSGGGVSVGGHAHATGHAIVDGQTADEAVAAKAYREYAERLAEDRK